MTQAEPEACPASTEHPIVPKANLVPFILIASCFALWGMLNMITDTLVPAVQKIFSISTEKSAYIQVVNYASYALLAFPAAVFIKRFSYKAGVLLGLSLLSLGAIGFVPAGASHAFSPLLLTISVMACGLSVLETSCNPYVLSMGHESTAVRRLNLAQTLNPVGCLLGLFVAKVIILGNLHQAEAAERATWTAEKAKEVLSHELFYLALPYAVMVAVAIGVIVTMLVRHMPEGRDTEHAPHVRESIGKLFANRRYMTGVLTQFFYVALQVSVWTFIIKYTREAAITATGADGKIAPGMTEEIAWYSLMGSMVVFTLARMICTALMKKFNPASMMATLAVAGIALTLVAIFTPGHTLAAGKTVMNASELFSAVFSAPGHIGVICLVLTSACMSLMFPTIYGIALRDLGHEVKLGASGLIMAIIGGSAGSFAQGKLIDALERAGHSAEQAVRYSFVVPVVCLVVVLAYALAYRAFCATAPKGATVAAGGH